MQIPNTTGRIFYGYAPASMQHLTIVTVASISLAQIREGN